MEATTQGPNSVYGAVVTGREFWRAGGGLRYTLNDIRTLDPLRASSQSGSCHTGSILGPQISAKLPDVVKEYVVL